MDAVEYIRQARPEVAEATPQETAAMKASFERMAAEQPGWFRSFFKRLSGPQLLAALAALLIVPAGAVAVATQVFDDDRSDQIEQAISTPPSPEIAPSLIEKCRELQAQGLENAPCADVLREIDEGEGASTPEP